MWQLQIWLNLTGSDTLNHLLLHTCFQYFWDRFQPLSWVQQLESDWRWITHIHWGSPPFPVCWCENNVFAPHQAFLHIRFLSVFSSEFCLCTWMPQRNYSREREVLHFKARLIFFQRIIVTPAILSLKEHGSAGYKNLQSKTSFSKSRDLDCLVYVNCSSLLVYLALGLFSFPLKLTIFVLWASGSRYSALLQLLDFFREICTCASQVRLGSCSVELRWWARSHCTQKRLLQPSEAYSPCCLGG